MYTCICNLSCKHKYQLCRFGQCERAKISIPPFRAFCITYSHILSIDYKRSCKKKKMLICTLYVGTGEKTCSSFCVSYLHHKCGPVASNMDILKALIAYVCSYTIHIYVYILLYIQI